MKIGVIGAGTMGQGIAKAFAQVEGFTVALCALNLSECLCDALAHSAGTDNAYLHSKYLQYKIKR